MVSASFKRVKTATIYRVSFLLTSKAISAYLLWKINKHLPHRWHVHITGNFFYTGTAQKKKPSHMLTRKWGEKEHADPKLQPKP